MTVVETQDLEDLAVHVANELGDRIGNKQLLVQELLKFYSLMKSHLGSRVSDAQNEILTKYADPLTYQLRGDFRELQVELYNSLNNF